MLGCLQLRFIKCKKKVAEAFPALDLRGISNFVPEEEAKREGEGGEEANGEAKTEAEPTNIEEVIETSKVDLISIP